MRRDWRAILLVVGSFLWGTMVFAAPRDGQKEPTRASVDLVRLTVEVSWLAASRDNLPVDGFSLELTEGRVLEAMDWPPDGRDKRTGQATPTGGWQLGGRLDGKVRARIEAPLDASLILRGGEQRVSVPLAAVLERRQQTPPQSAVTLTVERLPWDSLSIDLGGTESDGIFTKGDRVALGIGYNILQPDAAEVLVKTTAILRAVRGGAELWRSEQREALPANRRETPVRTLSLTAPEDEGVYTLEVQATWEAAPGKESSRLGRLIRRRKTAAASSAVRRVLLVVLDPRKPALSGRPQETEVDSIDLSKARTYRPLASGRSHTAGAGRNAWAVPPEALIEPSRRDRLRGWFSRTGGEASQLDASDERGLAWSAVGLRVAHPGKPHRMTLTIRGGEPAELGVAVIEPSEEANGSASHVLLDASASGPPILREGPHASFSWLIWPQSAESVLVLVNRNTEAMVRLGSATLTELEDLPASPRVTEPADGSRRMVGLYLTGTRALEPFGGDATIRGRLTAAQNLSRYLSFCGATSVVLPDGLSDRWVRRGLERQAEEDSTGPDQLDLVRTVLARTGGQLWREIDLSGPRALPGLPPADSAEAISRGLGQLDRLGSVEGAVYQPLHPDVQDAIKRRLLDALPKARSVPPGDDHGLRATVDGGLLVRLGAGPTLLGAPDSGLDDVTFGRFVHEKFSLETARDIPGQDLADADRFAVRSRYVSGVGRTPWLAWRASALAELYTSLTEAVQSASPGTTLALVTPTLAGGPVDAEARRMDLSGLAPSQAWLSVGLDLKSWPTGPRSPMVLRGASLSTDALAHDLATNSDLDEIVASRSRRGTLLMLDESTPDPVVVPASVPADVVAGDAGASDSRAGGQNAEAKSGLLGGLHLATRIGSGRGETVWLTAIPLGDGPAADEPLGHSLAALDSHCVMLSAKAVAGHEERIREFSQVLRSLPAWPTAAVEAEGNAQTRPFGVTLRTMSEASGTYLEIANDSPYPLKLTGRLDAPAGVQVEDLGREVKLKPVEDRDGRTLLIDLLPYGVSAVRVSASGAKLSSLTPHPSPAVVTTMQARFNELTIQLARLNRGLSNDAAEPPNAGFEPAVADAKLPAVIDLPERTEAGADRTLVKPTVKEEDRLPGGWRVEPSGEAGGKAEIDKEGPRVGQGSLRITAGPKPLSVVSESFVPATQSSLTLEAYFRSEEPGVKVRVWIEGQAMGQPYLRRSELTVTTQWESRAFRASDVPSGGLDTARVRFEVITPGVVWVDDLHVIGDSASKSTRLNTQRTLLNALQAYREARYADFARLAGSHWVRNLNSAAVRLARGGEYGKRSRGSSSASETSASALSQDSKLR